MWIRCLSWCLVFSAVVVSSLADMQESAWRARAMLGPGRWAQVVRIEQTRPGSAPGRVVYALVFELEDRLWYYEADQGTQSLSIRRGRLEQDKADLGPLLRSLDPGFGRYEIIQKEPEKAGARKRKSALPQGCFIECLAYLQTMIGAGRTPDDARLLAYYGSAASGHHGHTVLYFSRAGQRFFYDPEGLPTPALIPEYIRLDALAIARVAVPRSGYPPPARAVFLPLRLPAPGPDWHGRAIAAGGPGAPAHESAAPVLMN